MFRVGYELACPSPRNSLPQSAPVSPMKTLSALLGLVVVVLLVGFFFERNKVAVMEESLAVSNTDRAAMKSELQKVSASVVELEKRASDAIARAAQTPQASSATAGSAPAPVVPVER